MRYTLDDCCEQIMNYYLTVGTEEASTFFIRGCLQRLVDEELPTTITVTGPDLPPLAQQKLSEGVRELLSGSRMAPPPSDVLTVTNAVIYPNEVRLGFDVVTDDAHV